MSNSKNAIREISDNDPITMIMEMIENIIIRMTLKIVIIVVKIKIIIK